MPFNLNTYLSPISEHLPCGDDLSLSHVFHKINKARIHDDILLEQGEWIIEPRQADWEFVAKTIAELFIQNTKDIRLLSWLIEAWSHLYGFMGVAQGIELSHRVLEQYWKEIHPIIDDDLDQRIGLLHGLIHQLPTLIKQIPLTSHTIHAYTIFDYERLLYLQNKNSNTVPEQVSSQELTIELLEQELQQVPSQVLLENYQHFQNILKHWNKIKHVIHHLLDIDSPSFLAIDSLFEDIHQHLKRLYKVEQLLLSQTAKNSSNTSEKIDEINQSNTPELLPSSLFFQPEAQTHIENRQQAIQLLQEIAVYFTKNEPHSPVSYMLNKTIKWSQLPLHEWLTQVIKHEHSLESIHDMLGIQLSEINHW